MIFLWTVHISALLLISAALFFMTSHDKTLSFVAGGLVSGVILASLLMISQWLLGKKSVAPAISVIVLKYAFIGFISYRLIWQQKVDFTYFCGGLIVMVLTAFATGYYIQTKNGQRDS